MRPSAQPFFWKWVLFAWEWKIIFISKTEHLTWFWYRGPGKLGNVHMTSRRPYWCSKTMKRRTCWCTKQVLRDLNSLLMQMLSFVPINLHRCWPREWKHSIKLNNHIYIVKNFLLFPRPRLLKRWINKASLSSRLFKSRLFFFLVGFATSRLRHLLGLCASSCTELKLASLTFKKLWQVEV